ncbi:MAG: Gfo/Idh/MocA family oxidoreductase [Candidatus Ozemobacteraceae bacterium]
MKILVIGAGMYVTGRNGTGVGTILASLAESARHLPIEEVVVISHNPSGEKDVQMARRRIGEKIETPLKVRFQNLKTDSESEFADFLHRNNFSAGVVCVPDHLHFFYTKSLLENRIPALVVKPLTPTLPEAKELVRLSLERGVYGAVEFHKRFDETNLYTREALSQGLLGQILYFSIDYSQRITIPTETFRGWCEKTNIFQYLGVHYVDLIFFFTNFIPSRAMAIGTRGILHQKGIKTWDSVHAQIIWKDPANRKTEFVSQFAINWIDPTCTSALSDQKFKVIGTKGRLECDQKNRGIELVTEGRGIQHPNPYFSDFLDDGSGTTRFGGYGHKSIDRFFRDVLDLEQNNVSLQFLDEHRPNFRQSLVSIAAIDAVTASLNDEFAWKEIADVF